MSWWFELTQLLFVRQLDSRKAFEVGHTRTLPFSLLQPKSLKAKDNLFAHSRNLAILGRNFTRVTVQQGAK